MSANTSYSILIVVKNGGEGRMCALECRGCGLEHVFAAFALCNFAVCILQFCIFRGGLGLLLMCLACIHSVAED